MLDRWGRNIDYLRISVTDRCNFRCVYCMPPQGVSWQPHESIMRFEEIAEVVRVAAGQGIRRVRLTGGEPLVRAELEELVRMLTAIEGIDDLALTTNGALLAGQSEKLAKAGLKRVNISLDTLQPEQFARLTRGGDLENVWRGIRAAEAAGMQPIKINAVVVRGINDDELLAMASLTAERSWHVRFIELMPLQSAASWGDSLPTPVEGYLSITEMLERLDSLHLEPIELSSGSGPAAEYRIPGGAGRIGFISPLSDHRFCQRCNRIRLTADGNLRPCLMSDLEIPLLPALRAGKEILPLFRQAVQTKPQNHELHNDLKPQLRWMSQIGG